MGQSKSQTVAIFPLPKGYVLLPGVTVRIPVTGRSDVLSLLTSIYTRSKTPKPDAASVPIGCVPLKSPLLSSEGQQLIESGNRNRQEPEDDGDNKTEETQSSDLFAYGTLARIADVQGRRPADLTLVVEGIRRFRINTVMQERPFFEAAVTYLEPAGIASWTYI